MLSNLLPTTLAKLVLIPHARLSMSVCLAVCCLRLGY